MGRLTYFQIVLFLFCGVASIGLTGCDVSNSNRDKVSTQEPFFNFEIQDENGEILTVASSEQLNGKEIETGIGLFGEQFVSPDLIERLRENTGLDLSREAFRQKRIFLHAENGIGDSVQFANVNFSFSKLNEWREGRFEIRGFSKEQRLALLRRAFERFQQIRSDSTGGDASRDTVIIDGNVDLDSLSTEPPFHDFDPNETVFMNYFESDGGGFPHEYSFMPVEGFIELQNVTEDRITGSFEVELSGLRSEMFPSVEDDEFPEDPEFRVFSISGDFVAEHGNYEDLRSVRSEFIKNLLNSSITNNL